MKNTKVIAVLIVIFNLLSINYSIAQEEVFSEAKNSALMRQIGDAVLTHMALDTTTAVLPISKVQGKYSIEFPYAFQLKPGLLVDAVNNVMDNSEFPKDYLLEVENETTKEVVYSYDMKLDQKVELIPCQSRIYPIAKYRILFSFPDQYEEEVAVSTSFKWMLGLLLGLFLITIFLVFFILKRPIKKESSVSNNELTGNSDRTKGIGLYQFDELDKTLVHPEIKHELSAKECDLLTLLLEHVNQTVERDVILNAVWGDEGDYVGRTLDVFISKLRKKLSSDPNVKIDNIRGVGYKLVILANQQNPKYP